MLLVDTDGRRRMAIIIASRAIIARAIERNVGSGTNLSTCVVINCYVPGSRRRNSKQPAYILVLYM